jgi:hypothetical protein
LGDFTFNLDVGSTDDIIYIAGISTDGEWNLYNYIRVGLPQGENDWYPHLTFNQELNISFFGWGDLYFNSQDVIGGNGIINLYVNSLDSNNNWGSCVHVSGNISNPANNIITDGINIYVCGTYIVSFNSANGHVHKILLDR